MKKPFLAILPWSLGAFVLTACASHRPPVSEEGSFVRQYDFQMDETLIWTLQQPGEAPRALGTAPVVLSWRGELVLETARTFPDGSFGWLITLSAIESHRGTGSPWSPSTLDGLAFELRSFDTGEILQISGIDRLMGPDRLGDHLLPLWSALSPMVPVMDPGESVYRRSNLPLYLSDRDGLRAHTLSTWTRSNSERDTSEYRYKAEIEGKLRQTHKERLLLAVLQGSTEGLIKHDSKRVPLLSHDFSWESTLTLNGLQIEPATKVEPPRLVQKSLVKGRLSRAERPTSPRLYPLSKVQPHQALPLFLDRERALAVLHSAGTAWDRCFPGQETAEPQRVEMIVDREGRVQVARLPDPNLLNQDQAGCLAEVGRSLQFPASHAPETTLRYTVVRRSGSVQPFPEVEIDRPEPGSLLLVLPPDLQPQDTALIESLFGSLLTLPR